MQYRFVLIKSQEKPTITGSWDTFDEARTAALPIRQPGIQLIDRKTGIFWTEKGMFR